VLSPGAWVVIGVCAGLLAAYTAWCYESKATLAQWFAGLALLALVILGGLVLFLAVGGGDYE
jgi:hypothetical protein